MWEPRLYVFFGQTFFLGIFQKLLFFGPKFRENNWIFIILEMELESWIEKTESNPKDHLINFVNELN